MADDLKYGYKGAEPTQSFGNNTGVFDPNDINNLIADNKWTSFGQLELIETQTITTATNVIDFTNLGNYNVHFMTVNNAHNENDNKRLSIRFFENGVLESSAVYQVASQFGSASNNFIEVRSTTYDSLRFGDNFGSATNETMQGYCYFYNLIDSSKYSFISFHASTQNNVNVNCFEFGSGVLPQASTVTGIRLEPAYSYNLLEADISLYGIRYS